MPELASSFYPGGSVESRVRRLLDPASRPEFTHPLGGVIRHPRLRRRGSSSSLHPPFIS
jgi:hypothetical protein